MSFFAQTWASAWHVDVPFFRKAKLPRYRRESTLSLEEVLEKADQVFGSEGLDLDLMDTGKDCLTLEGDGSSVFIQTGEQAKSRRVDLQT